MYTHEQRGYRLGAQRGPFNSIFKLGFPKCDLCNLMLPSPVMFISYCQFVKLTEENKNSNYILASFCFLTEEILWIDAWLKHSDNVPKQFPNVQPHTVWRTRGSILILKIIHDWITNWIALNLSTEKSVLPFCSKLCLNSSF